MTTDCSNQRKPIPSYSKYVLGEDGEIRYGKSGSCVDTNLNADGEVIATLFNDRNSKHTIKLSRLVLLMFGEIDPEINYITASVKYKDGRKLNLNIENLEWVFDNRWKLPLIVPGLSCPIDTFVTLRNYSCYEIDIFGTIRRKHNGTYVAKVIGTRGYVVATLTNDAGYRAPVKVHRLMALTFLAHPDDVSQLVVNHKDGDKTNYTLSNLEWVTAEYNIQHAVINGLMVTNTKRRVLMMHIDSGVITEFEGTAACAAFFKVCPTTLHDPLRNPKGIRNYKGHYLKYADDGRPWPDRNGSPNIYGEIAVLTKNLETGEIKRHRSMQAVGQFLSVATASIFNQLGYEYARPYKGHLIRRECPEIDWSVDGTIRVLTDPTAKFKLTDLNNNEEKVYDSLAVAGKDLACSPASLYTAFRRRTPHGRYKIEQVKLAA